MKIQCDVCSADEASVFCAADEAALCLACDHRVHHANKLASKHQRFSLIQPSSKQFPVCDICQEKRAVLFCQQDRAILCKDCDVPIHKTNEHTKNHNRFLLTGVKLSGFNDLYISTVDSSSSVSHDKSQPSMVKKKPGSDSPQMYPPPSMELASTSLVKSDDMGETSSISEYLIETLPGWHVEDFLDSSSAPFGFCHKGDDNDFARNLSYFPSEKMGFWVPQTPSMIIQQDSQCSSYMNGQIGFKESIEVAEVSNKKWCDDGFTVPQIILPSTSSKRSRVFW